MEEKNGVGGTTESQRKKKGTRQDSNAAQSRQAYRLAYMRKKKSLKRSANCPATLGTKNKSANSSDY